MNSVYETDRLILRVETDKIHNQVLNFYLRNKDCFEACEPTRCEQFYTSHHHKNYLRIEYDEMNRGRLLRLWIYEKKNPREIIGTICFSDIQLGAFKSATLGYKIDQMYHRRGYAREACQKGIEIMFKEYGLERLEARIMPTNKPSLLLIEQLGFQFEGMEYQSVEINHKREDHMRFFLLP